VRVISYGTVFGYYGISKGKYCALVDVIQGTHLGSPLTSLPSLPSETLEHARNQLARSVLPSQINPVSFPSISNAKDRRSAEDHRSEEDQRNQTMRHEIISILSHITTQYQILSNVSIDMSSI
jgi:hypothetical protein